MGCRFTDCKFAHDLTLVSSRVVAQLLPFVRLEEDQMRQDRLGARSDAAEWWPAPTDGRDAPRRLETSSVNEAPPRRLETSSVNEAPIARKRVWGTAHVDAPPEKVQRSEPVYDQPGTSSANADIADH